jgi:hypothetical protein
MTFLGVDLETASHFANISVVVLGLALAIVSTLAFRWNDQLQARKDAELARFQAESTAATAQADARAAEANAKAAEAGKGAAKALADAAEANKTAEGFRLAIAKANERAATANETAERERLARLQLEARLADRVITDSQKARLIAALGGIKGQTVDVTIFGDTPDIAAVSDAILGCLGQAGVLFNVFSPFGATGVRGVIIGIKPDAPQAVKSAAGSVGRILKETLDGGVGIEDFAKLVVVGAAGTTGQSDGAAASGQSPLRIWIGAK